MRTLLAFVIRLLILISLTAFTGVKADDVLAGDGSTPDDGGVPAVDNSSDLNPPFVEPGDDIPVIFDPGADDGDGLLIMPNPEPNPIEPGPLPTPIGGGEIATIATINAWWELNPESIFANPDLVFAYPGYSISAESFDKWQQSGNSAEMPPITSLWQTENGAFPVPTVDNTVVPINPISIDSLLNANPSFPITNLPLNPPCIMRCLI